MVYIYLSYCYVIAHRAHSHKTKLYNSKQTCTHKHKYTHTTDINIKMGYLRWFLLVLIILLYDVMLLYNINRIYKKPKRKYLYSDIVWYTNSRITKGATAAIAANGGDEEKTFSTMWRHLIELEQNEQKVVEKKASQRFFFFIYFIHIFRSFLLMEIINCWLSSYTFYFIYFYCCCCW